MGIGDDDWCVTQHLLLMLSGPIHPPLCNNPSPPSPPTIRITPIYKYQISIMSPESRPQHSSTSTFPPPYHYSQGRTEKVVRGGARLRGPGGGRIRRKISKIQRGGARECHRGNLMKSLQILFFSEKKNSAFFRVISALCHGLFPQIQSSLLGRFPNHQCQKVAIIVC